MKTLQECIAEDIKKWNDGIDRAIAEGEAIANGDDVDCHASPEDGCAHCDARD